MLVSELYSLAKAMMFEKTTSKDYDNYYIPWCNVLLSENFDINNSIRVRQGKTELTDIPSISNPSDTLPYEDVICKEVLPYGLASKFFIDDDLSKFDIFNTSYQNAQMKYMRGNEADITDAYGGDA